MRTNFGSRVILAVILLSAAVPVPAMTPALLSGKLNLMRVPEGPRLALVSTPWFAALRAPRYGALPPGLDTPLLDGIEPLTVSPVLPVEEVGLDASGLEPLEALTPLTPIAWNDQPRTVFTKLLPPGHATSGVPEPATWVLLIMGFGLVGGVLRGRRRREAAAA